MMIVRRMIELQGFAHCFATSKSTLNGVCDVTIAYEGRQRARAAALCFLLVTARRRSGVVPQSEKHLLRGELPTAIHLVRAKSKRSRERKCKYLYL